MAKQKWYYYKVWSIHESDGRQFWLIRSREKLSEYDTPCSSRQRITGAELARERKWYKVDTYRDCAAAESD